MALKNCEECNYTYSQEAEACPSCGKVNRRGCGGCFIWFLLGLILPFIFGMVI